MHQPETNPRLEFFRSQIGKDMSQSISPLGRWLNGTLRRVEPGEITVEYLVREDLCNPMRVLHGGAAAAILDDLIGVTVFSLGRDHAYTSVNLNVDFLNPAREGELITATARIVRAGRNIVHTECLILGADGKIIAKAASNLVQTGVKI
ncbi:PaaI family thioesterase [Tellurirhabdus rosea]|uniref:PaaI family thioesterase n=1 Tax=Tellurirhabdus rosea TaxID=2674997 RepID=UPI00225220AC|nr:PaaI family thioesterase [Tellurirhabdus rosea]